MPGSEVRATALLQGHVKATIVDSTNWRIIQEKGGDKFKLLVIDDVDATDEALYANTEFLEREQAAVDILVEELVRTWREINANPDVGRGAARQVQPAAGPAGGARGRGRALFREARWRAAPSRTTAAAPRRPRPTSSSTALPASSRAIRPRLVVEDFWELGPLDRAVAKLGQG